MSEDEIQVSKEHYFNSTYDSKRRFCSYWHQIDEVRKLNPSSILEVGIGNGLVSDHLKKHGYSITTVDIDSDLNPDVVASIQDLPFKNGKFEVVMAYEVLEHLPFEEFSVAMQELKRVAQNYILISLPDRNRAYRFQIQLPKIGDIKFLIPIPTFIKSEHKFDGEHYWEIGKKIIL